MTLLASKQALPLWAICMPRLEASGYTVNKHDLWQGCIEIPLKLATINGSIFPGSLFFGFLYRICVIDWLSRFSRINHRSLIMSYARTLVVHDADSHLLETPEIWCTMLKAQSPDPDRSKARHSCEYVYSLPSAQNCIFYFSLLSGGICSSSLGIYSAMTWRRMSAASLQAITSYRPV